jgi:hypothetical protein
MTNPQNNTPDELESKNKDELDELLNHFVFKEGKGPNGSGGEIRYWNNGKDIPAKHQIQELIAKARIESYQKGYIDGGIGVMNGELPHKRQFVSKAELALQTKKG